MTTAAPESAADAMEVRSNPYAGPRALQQGEPIYGRVREINELRGLILSERIVLLYSQSGAGKTSLIEAGLRPEFERRRFHVMPTVRVGYETPDESSGANRYRLSLLASLESARPVGEQLSSEDIAAIGLKEYFQTILDADPGLDLFVVFDQFEEIFTLDPTDWAEKEAFLSELGIALANRAIFALFSMREDFIAQLDPYQSSMPTRFSNTYRLELLGPSDAKLAIQKPAEAAGVEFGNDAAQGLVDDLRRVRVDRGATSSLELGPSVEPVQLQVVCSQLWEHLDPGATVIRAENVDDIGNVNEALAGYYALEVAAVAARTHVKERSIRDWFLEKLISEDGFRTQTREGPGRKSENVLSQLEDAHLIRADRRRGTQWYELTHDRFVEPIRSSNIEFHRKRRVKLLKFLIPVGIVFLMGLTSYVVERIASPSPSEVPAFQLEGTSDQSPPEDVEAGAVKRYRFDDAVRRDVVTLVVTANSSGSSLGGIPDVEVRLLLLASGATDGEDIAVLPDSSTLDYTSAVDTSGEDQGDSATTTISADSTGRTAPQETVRRVELTYSVPASGSYFIEIVSSTGGTVELSFNREVGDPVTALEVAEPVDGTIDATTPMGSFDFDASEGNTVELVLDSIAPFDGILTVVNDAGVIVDSVDLFGVGEREVLVTTLPSDRAYSVEVSGFESSVGAYSLELRSPELVPIAAGSTIDGTTLPGGLSRVYSFDAAEGDAIVVTLSYGDEVFPILQVESELSRGIGFPTPLSSEVVQLWSGGDGVVVVSDPMDALTDFTLTFDSQTPTAIDVGAPVTAEAQVGQRLVFTFEGERETTYAVDVSDSDRFVVVIPPGDETIVSETFVAPFDGAYLIAVDRFVDGNFTIEVVEPELDAIAFGTSAIADTESFGTLWYTFDADVSESYAVTVESASITADDLILVTAPDGVVEVFEYGIGGDDRVAVNGIAPIAGTYLITFLANDAGSYTVALDH